MAARLEKTTGMMIYLYLFGMTAFLFLLYPFLDSVLVMRLTFFTKFLLPYLQANGGPDVQHIQQEVNLAERTEQRTGIAKANNLNRDGACKNRECSEQESDAQVSLKSVNIVLSSCCFFLLMVA